MRGLNGRPPQLRGCKLEDKACKLKFGRWHRGVFVAPRGAHYFELEVSGVHMTPWRSLHSSIGCAVQQITLRIWWPVWRVEGHRPGSHSHTALEQAITRKLAAAGWGA